MFKKNVFEMESRDKYARAYMNGINDTDMREFCLLSITPIMKDEYKKEQAEKEYARSYLEGAKRLAELSKTPKNSPVLMVLGEYSLAVPCLFLCRQAMELEIKNAITRSGGDYKHIHSIDELWKTLRDIGNKSDNGLDKDEQETINKMDAFIELICSLDNANSTKLRYPVEKDGSVSQKGVQFVSLHTIVNTAELFIKQLNEFDN